MVAGPSSYVRANRTECGGAVTSQPPSADNIGSSKRERTLHRRTRLLAEPHALHLAHGDISKEIIAAYFHVYNALAPRLAESVYHRAMVVALQLRGLRYETEVPLPVWFEGVLVGDFRADLIVERRIIVELKSADRISGAHEAQVYNYLRIAELPVGLLMNFGPKPSVRRLMVPREN